LPNGWANQWTNLTMNTGHKSTEVGFYYAPAAFALICWWIWHRVILD